MIRKVCVLCKKEYLVKNNREKLTKYCSKSCHAKGSIVIAIRTDKWKERISQALQGIKRNPEHMERLRQFHLGRKQTPEWIAKRVEKNLGKKRSAEVRKKMSLAMDKGLTSKNEKLRQSYEYREWRKHVFQRDDWTCQACGQRGGELQVDHELPFAYFPDLRNEVLNGRILCVSCHRKTESYGRKQGLINIGVAKI